MIKEGIRRASDGETLPNDLTKAIITEIMEGKCSDAQIAGWLCLMRCKGETISEITAATEVMRSFATKVSYEDELLDIVGTGGDCLSTFNVSTTCAIVVAAGGIKIAKHGNRSVSSASGSADVLVALGVNIDLDEIACQRLIKECGICFMFAPNYHRSMKHAAAARGQLGIRTLFNTIGPLTNPANANHQLLGVYDEKLVEPLAIVLKNLGIKRACVVHGHDGMDEISITGLTTVCELNNGTLNSYLISPEQFGLARAELSEIIGGTPSENAAITKAIFQGEKGAKRDIVVLNAAFCFYMFNEDKTIKDCIKMAEDIIDSGKAMEKLTQLIELSHALGGTKK